MQRISSPSLVAMQRRYAIFRFMPWHYVFCWALMAAVTKASRLKLWGFLKRRRREALSMEACS